MFLTAALISPADVYLFLKVYFYVSVCDYIPHVCRCPQNQNRGIKSPRTRVTRSYERPLVVWRTKLRSSLRASSALNYWAIHHLFKKKNILRQDRLSCVEGCPGTHSIAKDDLPSTRYAPVSAS